MNPRDEISVGAVVLHQRREDVRVVLERYRVQGVTAGQAILARHGQRALARVDLAVLCSSSAWAVGGRLW